MNRACGPALTVLDTNHDLEEPMKLVARLFGERTLQRTDGVVFSVGEEVLCKVGNLPGTPNQVPGVLRAFHHPNTARVLLEGPEPYRGEALVHLDDLSRPETTAGDPEATGSGGEADVPAPEPNTFTPAPGIPAFWPERFPEGAYVTVVLGSERLWAIITGDDGSTLTATVANDHTEGIIQLGDVVEFKREHVHAYVAPDQAHRLFVP